MTGDIVRDIIFLGSILFLLIPLALYIYYRVLRARNKPQPITQKEMEELTASGKPFTLVDVREVPEFGKTPREGAVNVPLSHIAYDTASWDRDSLYVLVCAKGIRAKKGAFEMASRGFRQARYLVAGLISK